MVFRPAIDVAQTREILRTELISTADWRMEKAAEFPQDPRNAAAAELLQRLVATVDGVPEEPLRLYALHWGEGEDLLAHIAEIKEALRRIGFGSFPADATEFLKEFTHTIE